MTAIIQRGRGYLQPAPDITIIQVRDHATEFTRWLGERADRALGIDCETNAADPWDPSYRLRTVQIADENTSWVIDAERADPTWLRSIVRGHRFWVAHYSEADIRFLHRGLPGSVRIEEDAPHIVDTQVALAYYNPRTVTSYDEAYGAIPLSKGLKPSSHTVLGTDILIRAEQARDVLFAELAPQGMRRKDDVTANGFATVDTTHPTFQLYAGLDPLITIRMWTVMVAELKRRGQWSCVRDDLSLQWHIDRATLAGLEIDGPYATWLDRQLSAVVDGLTSGLAYYGVNPSGMGPAVGQAFERLGLVSPKISRKTNAPSWDKEVIAALSREDNEAGRLAQALQLVRKSGKFRSAYIKPMLASLDRDGRIHCSMRAIGTITGRQSAERPPVQQLPKRDTRVRAAVRAARGKVLVTCDLSQGEPRTMAGLSGDRNLLADILSGDLNSAITTAVFGDDYDPAFGQDAETPHYLMRQGGKRSFLSWCYGASEPTVLHSLLLDFEGSAHPPPEIRQSPVAGWMRRYPDLTRLKNDLNSGPVVVLESGRICPLWDRHFIDNNGIIRDTGRASRKGLNYATQGTQRDLLAHAVHRLVELGWSWALRMLVHDEIVLEVPEFMAAAAARDLETAMTMTYRGVPIVAESKICGRTWMRQPDSFDVAELEHIEAA